MTRRLSLSLLAVHAAASAAAAVQHRKRQRLLFIVSDVCVHTQQSK